MTSVRRQLACIAALGFPRLWMVRESSYSTPERQRALNVYTQAVIRTGDWADCAAATPRLKRYLQDQTKPRVSSQERCSISRDVYRSLLVGGPNCEKLATLLIHVHQKKIPLHLNAKHNPLFHIKGWPSVTTKATHLRLFYGGHGSLLLGSVKELLNEYRNCLLCQSSLSLFPGEQRRFRSHAAVLA